MVGYDMRVCVNQTVWFVFLNFKRLLSACALGWVQPDSLLEQLKMIFEYTQFLTICACLLIRQTLRMKTFLSLCTECCIVCSSEVLIIVS